MKYIYIMFCALFINSAQAQETLSDVNFDADYFEGGSSEKPGVIVLTGSGGGKANDTAKRIANMGYNVLSLAYFDRSGSDHVPETLELIPVEYLELPKVWLSERSNGVVIYGLSKGAEFALVIGSHDPDYKGIVALAPSKVAWQGNPKDFSKIMESPSSWSKDGKGIPFVPYIDRDEQKRLGFDNRHRASLTNQASVDAARIKVENITAPILLLSGGNDQAWPSTEMANEICERIGSNCNHISYPDGSHLLENHQDEYFDEVELFLKKLP